MRGQEDDGRRFSGGVLHSAKQCVGTSTYEEDDRARLVLEIQACVPCAVDSGGRGSLRGCIRVDVQVPVAPNFAVRRMASCSED